MWLYYKGYFSIKKYKTLAFILFCLWFVLSLPKETKTNCNNNEQIKNYLFFIIAPHGDDPAGHTERKCGELSVS